LTPVLALVSMTHSITSLPDQFRTAIRDRFLVNLHPDITSRYPYPFYIFILRRVTGNCPVRQKKALDFSPLRGTFQAGKVSPKAPTSGAFFISRTTIGDA
jgi:hypothetical protein